MNLKPARNFSEQENDQWLATLEPKKEDVGPLDAKLWAIPANLPGPRFVLVAVDTALEVPAKAAEAAEARLLAKSSEGKAWRQRLTRWRISRLDSCFNPDLAP